MAEMQYSSPTCDWLQQTGIRHMEQNEDTDDVIYRYETDTFRFYGLADGQSGKQFCTYGGRQVLKNLAEYMERNGLQNLYRRTYQDELQYEMIRVIRETIDNLATQCGTDREEFSSTVVVLAYDPKNLDFLTVHLGDGLMICADHEGRIHTISLPENGITRQYTWLTTSVSAMQHLRIQKGHAEPGDRMILLSDGATNIACGSNLTQRARKMLEHPQKQLNILELIKNGNQEDDASVIILKFN